MGQLDTHIRVKLVGSSKAKPGESIFTSSGVFTVPKGVKEIEVFIVGGGSTNDNHNGGGGGYTKTQKCAISEGCIGIAIAAGGSIINRITTSPGITTISTNETIKTAQASGRNGGSGGGASAYFGTSVGGSDGGNGPTVTFIDTENYYTKYEASGGTGQGTTTRAFEEPDGTLYAGGGGGGAGWVGGGPWGSSGGSGGGGNGGTHFAGILSTSGSPNTGGGGGGYTGYENSIEGGSGIAIIRWGY